MNKPETKIHPDKLKEKSHLLYKIQQKHERWDVPKCALLIGAGCSYPTLPLGGGIIKYCQQLCYAREVFPAEAAALEKEFLHKPEASLLNQFIDDKKDKNPKITFEDYVTGKEKTLLERIQARQNEELKKIPSLFSTPDWKDYEEHFLNDAKYGFWLDAYNGSPRERQRLLEALIKKCKPSGAYIILALLIEKGLINNILITNFDDFINDTLLYYTSARPRFYADDELSQYISVYNNKPNIIKLHGDYRYANIKNTNEETFKLSKSMEDKLRELLQNLDLIVIGYNGSDYSVMNVLQQVKTPNCELLWCSLDENDVHWRVANLINNSDNSWFVKIKGFDDLIKDFYLEFIQKPPELVKKAQERQEEINRYIKEYNKELQATASTEEEKGILEKQETIWELYNQINNEKDNSKLIDLYSKVIDLSPTGGLAYNNRGSSFDAIKQYDKAIADFNKAIELDQKYAIAYYNRANSFYKVKQYDKAIVDYNNAIELDEKLAYAFNGRGASFYEKKQYDKAIADLNKAIELDQKLANPNKHLGVLYKELGQNQKALEYLDKAITLNPEYKEAYEARIVLYKTLGMIDKAEKDEEILRNIDTGNPAKE